VRSFSSYTWRNSLLLFLLAFGLWLRGATSPRADTIAEARHALTRGDWEAVASFLEPGLADQTDELDWRLLRAELCAARGQLGQALGDAAAIIEDYPDDRRARLLEARWLSHAGQLRSAQERFEHLIEATPEDRDLRTALALTFAWRGDWESARTRLDSVLAEDPYHEQAFLAHLRVLLGTGQTSAAWQRARQRDVEFGEQDPELGLFMAGLLARIGAGKQADSLASRPTTDPDLLQRQAAFRAVESIRAGDLDQGLHLLEQLRCHTPQTFDSFMEAANAHAAADQLMAARDLYEQALAITPERPEAHLGLARLASREGRLTGSLAFYQKITRLNPEAIEGWLGIATIARLLNDAALLEAALEAASLCAPRSATLHQEHLRLALFDGDSIRFEKRLLQYREEQPHDRLAQLWELRFRRAQGESDLDRQALALLDPFAPEIASQAMTILARTNGDGTNVLALLPEAPEPGLQSAARLAVAQRLAVSLHVDLARSLAESVSPDAERWVDALGSAWWAYLSTPVATEPLLESRFDDQARTIWLAAQIQRRLQSLSVETGSSLEDEWLLQRALWFGQWRDSWASTRAAADLRTRLIGLAPGWETPPEQARIQNAWSRSEQILPASFETFPNLAARARWRRYRFDYAEALVLLRQLQADYPAAAEPSFAQIEILQASGRWSEALHRLAQLANGPCLPLVRLQYAGLLRRSGRLSEAHHQLSQLAATGFDEPEYYRHQALLSHAASRPDEARQWVQTGLTKHPDSGELILLRADWFRSAQETAQLALLLDRPRLPGWINPDILIEAWPHMTTTLQTRILRSPSWWFNWQWLPWERLESRSIGALRGASRTAAANGFFDHALQHLSAALEAAIPDSEIWLQAGRLFHLDGQPAESISAYHYAGLLGLGRPDALTAELAQVATQRPIDAARELAERLDRQPDDPSIRKGLVLALLRAGHVTAADRALAPLLESLPEDPEVVLISAQVRGAMGRVRQARSLYHSLLVDDPLHPDAHAGRLALREIGQWGVAVAYEYATVRDITGSGEDLDDWQEAAISMFWRRPHRQAWGLDYRWMERHQQQAQEITLHGAQGLNRHSILRLHIGAALSGRQLPLTRLGLGGSYRITDEIFSTLDLRHLHFHNVDVVQAIPATTWRWNPRGTVEGRLYLSQNLFANQRDKTSVTGLVQASWRFAANNSVALHYAIGEDDSIDPVPGIVANNSFQSVGIQLRIDGPSGWVLHPAYRYERHQRFALQAFGLAVAARF
jgi:tetratricopeptide (TPR) repeat protein